MTDRYLTITMQPNWKGDLRALTQVIERAVEVFEDERTAMSWLSSRIENLGTN